MAEKQSDQAAIWFPNMFDVSTHKASTLIRLANLKGNLFYEVSS